METMPDIVGKIDVEAEIHDSEQGDGHKLFLARNGICEEIKRNKNNGCHSAENIGKNIFTAAADCGINACKVICKEIED